jgi:hypothetical protein
MSRNAAQKRRFARKMWKSRRKIAFRENLHFFFMCGLINFHQAAESRSSRQADPLLEFSFTRVRY